MCSSDLRIHRGNQLGLEGLVLRILQGKQLRLNLSFRRTHPSLVSSMLSFPRPQHCHLLWRVKPTLPVLRDHKRDTMGGHEPLHGLSARHIALLPYTAAGMSSILNLCSSILAPLQYRMQVFLVNPTAAVLEQVQHILLLCRLVRLPRQLFAHGMSHGVHHEIGRAHV